MKLVRSLLVGALIVGAGAAASLAQEEGRIEGTLARDAGSPVAGASVVLEPSGAADLTDGDGAFRFSAVPAGTYTLHFTLGSNVASEAGVEVVAGETAEVEVTVDWELSFAEMITVTSASRRAERIVEAPAAVTLVTAEEIDRQASHGQVPKLLEFTPGAEVTQSGVYDYNLNTRGFNSSLNRRVATLIDGRDPSVPFLGAQEWAAISFPLDDLERVELVRGPSAALYGANASSGVLNMTTKSPATSRGGEVRVTAGELSTFNTDFRYGGALGGGWFVKMNAGTRDHGDFAVSRMGAAEYTVPCDDEAGIDTDCLPQEAVPLAIVDDDEIDFGSVRFDKSLGEGSRLLTIEGGHAQISGPAFQTGIGRVQLVDVERPWARFNLSAPRWNFLAAYTGREAPRQLALASGANLALDTENIQLELQGNWGFADDRGRLVLGASYSEDDIDSRDPATGAQTLIFEPVDADFSAAFGQLDWEIGDSWKVVLAGRVDESSLHDTQFSPKASLVYSVNRNNTLRLTYNEAFQVANYSEFFLDAPADVPTDLTFLDGLICAPFGVDCGLGVTPVLALGNEDLEVEEVESWELGYSAILGRKAYLTVDYYRSDNENFITDLLLNLGTPLGRVNPNFGPWEAPAGVPDSLEQAVRDAVPLLSNNVDGSTIIAAASYTNFGKVDTEGVDVGLSYHLDDAWALSGTYSWFDFSIEEDAPGLDQILIPNSPENKVSLGVSYSAERWSGSLSGRWVDDFRWVVGPFQGDVESYTTMDLSAQWRVSDRWELGLNVTNLLDEEHWQSFGGDILERRALGHVAYSW